MSLNGKEVWKQVVGFEGFYEVSNIGRVRSVDHVIPAHIDKIGRHIPDVTKKGKIIDQREHQFGY